MNLEHQVCSLELAKKLKKLGVKQKSLFTWVKNYHSNDPWRVGNENDLGNNQDAIIRRLEPFYTIGPSAFTTAELGEMLPEIVRDNEGFLLGDVISRKVTDKFYCGFTKDGQMRDYQTADTEADARAKMLIYLKENNLI